MFTRTLKGALALIVIMLFLVMPTGDISSNPLAQVRYAGPFHNTANGIDGSVIIDISIGTSDVSGYINFTNEPGAGTLCGAGSFTGTRDGDKIQFSFASSDTDYGCATIDKGWTFNVSATLSGNQLVNGSYTVSNNQGGTFSAKKTSSYTGRFKNTSNGLTGAVDLDIAVGADAVAGYMDFTNDPGGAALCGAGSFTGTRTGDGVEFSFISSDSDSGCTFDDGWIFNIEGTLSGNAITSGSYYIPANDQSGTFSVEMPASDAPFKVYEHIGQEGAWCYSVYPQANDIHSTCNDKISSVYLDAGWSVKLYRDSDQKGPSACLSRSDNDLRDNTFTDGSSMHDAVSSFVLYDQPGCDGTPSPGYPLEVYGDANFSGTRCYSTEAETANIHWSCNDKVSSILLRSGWSIRVYRDTYQKGPSVCLNASDADLNGNTFGDGSALNDAISSFVLYDQSNCAGSAAAYPLMVYHDTNQVGGWCYSVQPETANIHPYCNDLVSSVLLEPGWSMRVYRDRDQNGPSVCLDGSDNDLTDNTFDDGSPLNDTISSFVLYDEPACGSETSAYPFVVYVDADYAGEWCYSTQPETNNIYSSCNDLVSALKLNPGWSVRVYSGPNQSGSSACFSSNDPDLSNNTFDDGSPMNDTLSSFALYHQSSCPSPSGKVVRTQAQGFDTCAAPTVATMRKWSESSPYDYIGIYIGGDSRACRQDNLSPSWLSQVAAQGWDFIPIWVGPQAPCTAFRSRLPNDTTAARAQGVTEARRAINAAYSLGLTNESKGGTVIYYDMERYDTNNVQCRNAVNAFLEGWVSELQVHNNTAGVYGSPYNAIYWDSNTPRPDAVWFAIWDHADPTKRYYNPDAAIYGIYRFSDNLWRSTRIRQYDGGHTEIWGNTRINIDSNVADGLVASVGQNRSTRSTSATAATVQMDSLPQSNIQEMHFFTETTGWLLNGQQIFWTTTGGEQWQDITPQTGTSIVSAFFLDSQNGWAVSATDDGTSLTVLRTTDGGLNWHSTPLSAFAPSDGDFAHSVYLDFVDQQTGWVAVKLPAGVNFSQGVLFKTIDGGVTWTEQTLPIGDPVHFITSDMGWVAGGPGGDQLYVTRDGGETWEPQVILSSENADRNLIYGLPVFSTSDDGIMPITVADSSGRKAYIYATQDGGETWKLADTLSLDAQTTLGRPMVDLLDSSHWVVAGTSTDGNLPSHTTLLDFASSNIGWAYTRNGTCTPSDEILNCSVEDALLKTTDGGQTWTAVDIPNSPSYTVLLPLLLRGN